MSELVYEIDGIEIWHGNSLDPACLETVMRGRRSDLLSVDAPYSGKTHDGHRAGKVTADRASGFGDPDGTAIQKYASRRPERQDLSYDSWSTYDVTRAVQAWHPHCAGWFLSTTDHVLAPDWHTDLVHVGRYVFQPLPWVELGSRVRMQGDGPSSWTCWLIVARPRSAPYSKWGTLKGAYVGPGENKQNRPQRIMGAKSLALTCELVSDYSRPGDLVLDPCAGGGTTLTAARMTRRRAIGIELDGARAELIARLLRDGKRIVDPRQESLLR